MSETRVKLEEIKSDFEKVTEVLKSFKESGLIVEAFFHGSFVHTPNIPHDIDVLIFVDTADENLESQIQEALKEYKNVDLSFYDKADALEEFTLVKYMKKRFISERFDELMKVSRVVGDVDSVRTIRLLGLRSFLTNSDLPSQVKLDNFLSFKEDAAWMNEPGSQTDFDVQSAVSFIDGLIESLCSKDTEVVGGNFTEKLTQKLSRIQKNISNRDWKYVTRLIRDIYSSKSFLTELFETGSINLEGKKVTTNQFTDLLDQ